MDSNEFRDVAKSSIDAIADYFDKIADLEVVSRVEPGYLRKLLPLEAPPKGEPWEAIRADLEKHIMPGITHWQHPSFHAFFPCASSYPSMLGELYSAALSGANFNWINSPAATELETIVMDWLAKMLGLPECYFSTGPTFGGGIIQGGASLAVLTAMVAAREKYLCETLPSDLAAGSPEREDAEWQKRSRLVALASTATHSSAKKAAQVLGLRFQAIPVRAEDGYGLTRAGLEAALQGCRARGLEPFFLAATLGTTDTCAVDDFAGITATLEGWDRPAGRPGELWVHVDAAYAGAALCCPEAQAATHIERVAAFHSFNVNMHKWMLVHFDASCLFVRDRAWLTRALSVNQAVYVNAHSEGGLVTDYRDWEVPLGRRFRALKVWFVLRSYGVEGMRAYIRRSVGLSEDFAGWLAERPDLFEIMTGPAFALTVFRLAGGGAGANEGEGEGEGEGQGLAERNVATKALCDRVNASGKMWVTSTVLDKKVAIRMCTAGGTTEREHVRAAYDLFVKHAEELLSQGVPNGVRQAV